MREEFLVCETLGRGSSGIVHRVKRLRDGQILAMKAGPRLMLHEGEKGAGGGNGVSRVFELIVFFTWEVTESHSLTVSHK